MNASIHTSWDDIMSQSITYDLVEYGSPEFEEVLQLRQECYETPRAGEAEALDAWSLHFTARLHGILLGSLRVTCRIHGAVESEEKYPAWLLDEFGDTLCASSRMCVQPGLQGKSNLPLQLKATAWRHVLPQGIRLDVSKARLKTVPFYMRLGYFFVAHKPFPFTGWQRELGLRECVLLAFPADCQHPSPIQEVFTGTSDPCRLGETPWADRFIAKWRDARQMIPLL